MPEETIEVLEASLTPTIADPAEKTKALAEVSKVEKKIHYLAEHAMESKVESAEDLPNAMMMIDQLKEFGSTMESLVELFRKPAYDHYKRVQALKKSLLSPIEEATDHLRDEIARWKEEAERKLLEAKQEWADGNLEEAGDRLLAAHEALETEVEGLSYRTYWKAECVDLKALCEAIGKGQAPLSLVQFNQTSGNSLARSLRDVMRFPGVRVYSEKRPVIK